MGKDQSEKGTDYHLFRFDGKRNKASEDDNSKAIKHSQADYSTIAHKYVISHTKKNAYD